MSEATYRLQLPKQDTNASDERTRAVLTEVRRRNGMIPNMYAYLANAPEVLETYLAGYEKFRSLSGFTPAEQEVIFLTISYENGCDYCMAAHSVIAEAKSKVPQPVTEAIRDGAPIPDVKLAALAAFTRTVLLTRGRPTESDVHGFLHAGYSEKQVLDVILAIAVKTLSNYSNHLFATPLDDAFKAREWAPAAVQGR
ncbi:carboxymuconolactone decarboxylase family protein [bacterium]|nr:MAG: carboxymuconolactone decarboxylase family protein [bacterium]